VIVTVLAAATNDPTGQKITTLVLSLVAIAVVLAALTVWFWIDTSPKRRAQRTDHATDPAEPFPVAGADGRLVPADTPIRTGQPAEDRAFPHPEHSHHPAEGPAPQRIAFGRRSAPVLQEAEVIRRAGPRDAPASSGDAAAETVPAEGLSDEAWASLQQSVLERLHDR
jgi:HAMP domain-containing protein